MDRTAQLAQARFVIEEIIIENAGDMSRHLNG